jgi:uncharacterized protein YbjT (DUF2867 family)
MADILITGGTGVLGRAVAARLQAQGASVRVGSRRPPPSSQGAASWAQMDLTSGEGLTEAVRGVQSIVHCASSPARQT